MTNLKLFMMFEGGVSTQLIANPRWQYMSDTKVTVYFHPEESVHELVGELFLKNYTINFIPFNDPVRLPERESVFFLVRVEPEGNWDRQNNCRWAYPAKGTRVR